jgi:methionyl-tRNA formyltransferase
MRIFIITMEDPVFTNAFIREIIDRRRADIVGLAVSRGDRLTVGRGRSKIGYLISLLLILGLTHFIRYVCINIAFRINIFLSGRTGFVKDPSISAYAEQRGIPAYRVTSPNSRSFLKLLAGLEVDVIVNQGQGILKERLLAVPAIGVINRHNSLLPRNRGRMAPFWALYRGEAESGVSIHFVDKGIDSGDIIVQERFGINQRDNFNTIVKKSYRLAVQAMLEALDLLESKSYRLTKNDDASATYNSTPGIKEALKYRMSRIRGSVP